MDGPAWTNDVQLQVSGTDLNQQRRVDPARAYMSSNTQYWSIIMSLNSTEAKVHTTDWQI